MTTTALLWFVFVLLLLTMGHLVWTAVQLDRLDKRHDAALRKFEFELDWLTELLERKP